MKKNPARQRASALRKLAKLAQQLNALRARHGLKPL